MITPIAIETRHGRRYVARITTAEDWDEYLRFLDSIHRSDSRHEVTPAVDSIVISKYATDSTRAMGRGEENYSRLDHTILATSTVALFLKPPSPAS